MRSLRKGPVRGLACLLLAAACLLCGCRRAEPQQPAVSGSAPESAGESDDGGVPLIRNGEVCFTVICGDGLDREAERAVDALISRMENAFGVELPAQAEPWSDGLAGKTCIVFGRVDTAGCDALWERIAMRDYAVSVADGNIYIASGFSSGYGMAVNLLLSHLTGLVEEESPVRNLSLSAEYTVYQEGNYALKGTQVNGVELRDMVLLEPTDPLITHAVFEKLTANLIEGYGRELTTAAQRPEGAPVLRMELDTDMEQLHYGYRVENGDLIICAGGPFSMYCAAEAIVSLLRAGADGRGGVQIQEREHRQVSLLDRPEGLEQAEGSSLRLMSCNIMANGFEPGFEGWSDTGDVTFEMRTEIFESFVGIFQPDVIGIQEFSPSWYAWWEEAYAGTPWRLAATDGDRSQSTGMINPIMYRSDRYRLVVEGWRDYSVSNSQRYARYMSWVVLESIATGERFALVNVHWDGWSKPEANAVQRQETLAKIRELAETYRCPVFNTGDFNTNEEAPDYEAYLADGYMKDAKFNCDIQVNNVGSCHGWATQPAGDWSFDHIFTTQDAVVRQFCTASYNQQIYASDHAWLLADIDVSPEGAQPVQ